MLGRKHWNSNHGGNASIFMASGLGLFRAWVFTASTLQISVEGGQSRLQVAARFYRVAIDWRNHQLL